MKVYLDVCCLNRPFDDQRQIRVRIESEAVLWILQQIDVGKWQHVSSEMTTAEVLAMRDPERQARILALLPPPTAIMRVTPSVLNRAAELQRLGLRTPDAVHVAAAEVQKADAFLTCDDQLLRVARRHRRLVRVAVSDPVAWVREHEHE